MFEDGFPFPMVGYVSFLEGNTFVVIIGEGLGSLVAVKEDCLYVNPLSLDAELLMHILSNSAIPSVL